MEIKISELALKIIAGTITTIALAIISSNNSGNSNHLDNTLDDFDELLK
ncbi:hypothetical protein [Campylobacter sp. MG1]|nr:hypothetical protein [Campylobacter sp. MG1]